MILVLENEVDPEARWFVPEIVRQLPAEVAVHDAVAEGGRPSLDDLDSLDDVDDFDDFDGIDDLDGVVLAGSTAGVYEEGEHPWMSEEKTFVRDLLDREIPALGICFGHQLVNDALGGRVEHRGLRAELLEADLTDDPLFEHVSSTIPAVHGDVVRDAGDGMRSIASVENYEAFATRHADAPMWTVQYHPEFTARFRDRVAREFGWRENCLGFGDVTASRTLANFVQIASDPSAEG
jgi:GMP synthase (glutamine-hydrolysing)